MLEHFEDGHVPVQLLRMLRDIDGYGPTLKVLVLFVGRLYRPADSEFIGRLFVPDSDINS